MTAQWSAGRTPRTAPGALRLTMAPRTPQLVLLFWAVAMAAVPAVSSDYSGLDLYKYFVNQTFTQRQFACSKEEVECFNNLQLLYEADGKCYTVGEQGPCAEGEIFHADKEEASRKGGHIRGTCSSRCGDGKFPVGATGECLTKEEVEIKICREDLYLRPAFDAFGQWVCDWTEFPCQVEGWGRPSKGQYDLKQYNGLCFSPDILRNWRGEENITISDKDNSNHPILELFTNTTYRDREYPCTEEEKACLQYGRILHSDGNCYVPGEWNSMCGGERYYLDWEEAKKGRLIGTCNYTCTGIEQPIISSGICDTYNNMIDVCRWQWGLEAERNEFGELACGCAWRPFTPRKPPPSLPPPASGPGLCRVPDFSNPVQPPTYDMTLSIGFHMSCSEEEFACLREGRVLAGGACHALRTRGPCADGEELVLDKHALAHARLQAVCKARPCPEGSVLMPIDGQCLTHKQVVARLCEGQKVALDEFGGWQCDFQGEFPANLSSVVRHGGDGSCELPDKYSVYTDNPIDSASDTGVTEADESVANNTVY